MPQTLLSSDTRYVSAHGFRLERSSRQNALVRIHPAEGLGELFDLAEGTRTVGRDLDCDVYLPDDSVSRRHGRFEISADECVLSDLGSTNGIYVNDERITRRRLAAGDCVRLGNQIFRFVGGDSFEAEYYEAVYRVMTTDGLTQAYNKRYLLEVLERELSRAQRTSRPFSVAMFDVDRFKSINDEHGHLAGDEVLRELCRRARTILRAGEVLARYGGEEFTLVLAESSLEEARNVGERLRQAVAASPFAVEGADIPVTVSVGIATMSSPQDIDVDQLLARADAQLYAAKRSGRNRVCG